MVLVESAQHFLAGLFIGQFQDIGDLVGVEPPGETLQVLALHILDHRLLERPREVKKHLSLPSPGQPQKLGRRGIRCGDRLLNLCEIVHLYPSV